MTRLEISCIGLLDLKCTDVMQTMKVMWRLFWIRLNISCRLGNYGLFYKLKFTMLSQRRWDGSRAGIWFHKRNCVCCHIWRIYISVWCGNKADFALCNISKGPRQVEWNSLESKWGVWFICAEMLEVLCCNGIKLRMLLFQYNVLDQMEWRVVLFQKEPWTSSIPQIL